VFMFWAGAAEHDLNCCVHKHPSCSLERLRSGTGLSGETLGERTMGRIMKHSSRVQLELDRFQGAVEERSLFSRALHWSHGSLLLAHSWPCNRAQGVWKVRSCGLSRVTYSSTKLFGSQSHMA